jgi:TetR/AcrR family transcriptional repressor of multidrug resistance operon
MKTDILMMEKRAIFEASLNLLRAGKFQGTPLTEIAFLAKMSGRMIEEVFESREKLLEELSETLTTQITKLIEEAAGTSNTFKQRFFHVWVALYKHYTKNPNVIAFLEQFENIKVLQHPRSLIYPGNSAPLIELFSGSDCTVGSAETLAAIFHSNVLSAAKMSCMSDSQELDFKPELFSQLLWTGMYCPGKKAEEARNFVLY